MDPYSTVQKFIACINAGDVEGLSALMTEDHTFVDAMGDFHPGRDAMTEGWRNFVAGFPDYRISIENALADGDVVAAFGWASGSAGGDPTRGWRFPAAFRATVRDGKIAEWRVYADIEPMARSIGMDRFAKAKPAAQ